jgi:hypothetical protein
MRIIGVHHRIGSFAIALLLQISPALAGVPDSGPAIMQGSRFPGFPVPNSETAQNKHRRPVTVTFTKWVTEVLPPDPAKALPSRLLMKGFTEGDIAGDFVGEVLNRQVSQNGRIIWLEAMYEVVAKDHSFTALIRGGTGETITGEPAAVSGAALLDGVILTGWRTGAKVHVAFQTTTDCPRVPDHGSLTCFRGTITIGSDSQD